MFSETHEEEINDLTMLLCGAFRYLKADVIATLSNPYNRIKDVVMWYTKQLENDINMIDIKTSRLINENDGDCSQNATYLYELSKQRTISENELKRVRNESKNHIHLDEDKQDKGLGLNQSMTVKEYISEIKQKIREMEENYSNSQKSSAIGLQNVYDKFLELERRQEKIEALLKSDRIFEILKLIPKEEQIEDLLARINNSTLGKVKDNIQRVREELEELTDRFKF